MSRGDRRPTAWPLLTAGAAMLLGSAGLASAQEIAPNDFLPAARMSTLIISFTGTGARSSTPAERIFRTAAPTRSSASSNSLTSSICSATRPPSRWPKPSARSQSDGRRYNFGTATGASNLSLAAFFWPYANFQRKDHLVIGGYVVKLSDEERERLNTLIRAGKHPTRQLTKARVLLKADASETGEGWRDCEIAAALDTSSIPLLGPASNWWKKASMPCLSASIPQPRPDRASLTAPPKRS